MHYLFRTFLGYRLGTFLSYYAQIVIYYQAKRLLKNITKSESKLIPIIANMSYLIFVMYETVGSYYIDIFSAVFVLEIICLAIESKQFSYLSFLCAGIATGIKLPNIIMVGAIFAFCLARDFKVIKLKIKDIAICISLFLLPFIIYEIDNIIQTRNPFFPCLNSIFGGEYFSSYAWKDTRFGLSNPFLAFIWPFVIIIYPSKTYDLLVYDFIWPIGYAFVIGYMIYGIIKQKNIKEDAVFQTSILAFLLTIIWALFLNGYARYASYLPVLYLVVFAELVLKTNKKFMYVLWIAIAIFMLQASFKYFCECAEQIKYNFILFKQYGFIDDRKKEKIEIDGAWIVLGKDSKITSLVRKEGNPIYNLEINEMPNKNAQEKQEELKREKLYFLVDDIQSKHKLKVLKEEGFEIVEVIKEDMTFNFLDQHNKVDLYRVEYKGVANEN